MSRPDVPLERSIVRSIMRALQQLPGCMARKRHGTPWGRTGDPDIYVLYQGRHYELEVKRPGGRLTEIQRQRLREWARAGAITAVVHSASEALDVVRGGSNGR